MKKIISIGLIFICCLIGVNVFANNQIEYKNSFDKAAEEWNSYSGNWSINKGRYFQSDKVNWGIGSALKNYIVSNGTIEFDMKFSDGSGWAGLLLRKESSTDDHNSKSGQLMVFLDKNNNLTVANQSTGYYEVFRFNGNVNDYIKIKVEMQGSHFKIFINDMTSPTFSKEVANVRTDGYISLLTGGMSVYFDNVVVEAEGYDKTNSGNQSQTSDLINDFVVVNDINGHWAADTVKFFVKNGIINGYSDGTFKPDNNINKDEFLKLLLNSMDEKCESVNDYWASGYIIKAKQLGIITNDEANDLSTPISRYEAANFISRVVKESYTENYMDCISNVVDVDNLYLKSVSKVVSKGIMSLNTNLFSGNNLVTRAEGITIIERVLFPDKRVVVQSEEYNFFDDFSNSDSAWSKYHGDWKIEGGKYVQKSLIGWANLVTYKYGQFKDFTMKYKLKLNNGNGWAGVLLRKKYFSDTHENNRGIMLITNCTGGIGVIDGITKRTANSQIPDFDIKKEYLIKVEMQGAYLKVFLDKDATPIIQIDLGNTTTQGYISLISGNTDVSFDDVSITGELIPVINVAEDEITSNDTYKFNIYDAKFGTPFIDGKMDELWNNAQIIDVSRQNMGSAQGATGKARVLWDENYIYAYVQTADKTLTNMSSLPWDCDSIEFYIDPDYNKGTKYDPTDSQYRVDLYNNMTGTNVAINAKSSITMTDYGYDVEIAIPVSNKNHIDKNIGFDMAINDAQGNPWRGSMNAWNSSQNNAWSTPNVFGKIILK